jgi:hypothetical protein
MGRLRKEVNRLWNAFIILFLCRNTYKKRRRRDKKSYFSQLQANKRKKRVLIGGKDPKPVITSLVSSSFN